MKQDYVVQWRYISSLGNFVEGEIVNMEAEEAAVFNRDSPGVLVPSQPESPADPSEDVPERAIESPPRDRMFRKKDVETREVEATPAAVDLARKHGINLADVEGSGVGGKVTVGDVREFVAQ